MMMLMIKIKISSFDDYAIKGGLAGSYAYRIEKDRTNYIKEVYETIVTRIWCRNMRSRTLWFYSGLSEFLMDNISNPTLLIRSVIADSK